MPTILPWNEQILVRRLDPDAYKGPLIIPDVAKEARGYRAEVIAVGPGEILEGTMERRPVIRPDGKPLEPRTQILVSKWMGHDLKVDGAEFAFITEKAILGVIEDDVTIENSPSDPASA